MLDKLIHFVDFFLPPEHAGGARPDLTLQLATVALLTEVMRSDAECTAAEQALILRILKERFHLADAEVRQLAEHGRQVAEDATDLYQFTSLINREAALPEKVQLIEYLWRVAYADGKLGADEEHLMRKLGDLLHVPHGDYICAKMRAESRAGTGRDDD